MTSSPKEFPQRAAEGFVDGSLGGNRRGGEGEAEKHRSREDRALRVFCLRYAFLRLFL